MPTGEITHLHTETCIGVIRAVGASEELFFHAGSLASGTFDHLVKGQIVEFERQPYRNSPSRGRAVNVRPVPPELA